jgi:hypothetical protein
MAASPDDGGAADGVRPGDPRADEEPPLWIYGYAFGSNVSFVDAGNGTEADLAGGAELRLADSKLALSPRVRRDRDQDGLRPDDGERAAALEPRRGWAASASPGTSARWSRRDVVT